jgi:hypothetical protein
LIGESAAGEFLGIAERAAGFDDIVLNRSISVSLTLAGAVFERPFVRRLVSYRLQIEAI